LAFKEKYPAVAHSWKKIRNKLDNKKRDVGRRVAKRLNKMTY